MTISRRRVLRVSRNTVLFVVGLAGVAHQTLVVDVVQLPLLLAFLSMIGLPPFLTFDERRLDARQSPPADPGPAKGGES